MLQIGGLCGHLKYKIFPTCKFSDLVALVAYTQHVICFLSKQMRTERCAGQDQMRPPWSLTVCKRHAGHELLS